VRARRALIAALLIALGVPASGCSAPPALPDGVVVDLYQTRLDVAERVVEIAVTNGAATPLTVISAELRSDAFAETSAWPGRDGGTIVPAGATVDLPVAVPPSACTDAGPPSAHGVRLGFLAMDGRLGAVELVAADRHGQLAQLRAEDCLAERVAAVATISATAPPVIGSVGGSPAILLPLEIVPTGGGGDLELLAIRSTVLLTALDPASGAPLDAVRPALRIAGTDDPSELVLAWAPGRCDAHVIAEDKQGTVLTVEVRVEGTTGTILVRADDATRNALYGAVAEMCGLPG